MKLSVGRSPPTDGKGAYHLPVASGVVLHAKTLDELKKNVFEYRLRHNIDPGDIEADINSYYCGKWPSFCSPDKDGIGKSERQRASEMLNRVSRWVSGLIHRMPRGGYALALSAEAETRAAICVQCPKNAKWASGCGGCDASTLTLLQQIKSLRKTTKDGNLGACQPGGWGNVAAVHLPVECMPITDGQRNMMPVECWRRSL